MPEPAYLIIDGNPPRMELVEALPAALLDGVSSPSLRVFSLRRLTLKEIAQAIIVEERARVDALAAKAEERYIEVHRRATELIKKETEQPTEVVAPAVPASGPGGPAVPAVPPGRGGRG